MRIHVAQLVARIRRGLRPPRVVALTRRPAGWLAVGRRQLESVVAWAVLEDGEVVGLVAFAEACGPAVGWRYSGYLPGAAHSPGDVQPSPPAVTIPVADLVEAIGDPADTWTPEAMGAIGVRLSIAARDEWATDALLFSMADPTEFLAQHFRLIAEHNRPAELDVDERAWLASLTAAPPDPEESRAPGAGRGACP